MGRSNSRLMASIGSKGYCIADGCSAGNFQLFARVPWLVRPSPLRHIAELSPLPTPAFDKHDLEAGALTVHPRLDVNRQRP